jgi:cell division protein FtsA
MGYSKVVGAIEIGTSKVAILIGEISNDGSLNIIGHYTGLAKGVKKGVIVDLEAASASVHASILRAENEANVKISEVYLAQTGMHLKGIFNVGTANVSSSDGLISKSDIERAKEDAKRPRLPEGRVFINHIQNPFSVDGVKTENPLHKKGRRLKVGYWAIHADSKILQDSLRVIRGVPLDVEDVILSSIASSNVLLHENEKKAGALVIDIGGGTTDFALYRDGFIVYTGVIPVGGDHISNDLSMGLRTSVEVADKLKLREGLALEAKKDPKAYVWLVGNQIIGDREIPLISVSKIVESRLKEIFEIIVDELTELKLFNKKEIASGVVLTGGTSNIIGIEHLVSRVMDLECRLGSCHWDISEDLNVPEYTTALGLLSYAVANNEGSQSKGGSIINFLRGFLDR